MHMLPELLSIGFYVLYRVLFFDSYHILAPYPRFRYHSRPYRVSGM